MSKFELDQSIRDWSRKLRKNQHLEPGDIEELEMHLRDSIEHLTENGKDPESAFNEATEKIEVGFEEVIEDYQYSSPKREPRSKWFSSWWIPALLPNILKITIRNFKRQPGYSFINLTGLAIGMACCLIIYLFVQDELSYDQFHEKSERIYRIDQTNIWSNFTSEFSSTGPGVATTLKSDFPEIETIVRINNPPDLLVTIQNSPTDIRYFEEVDVLSADSTFFDIFTMEFTEGTPETALNQPYTFVITEETKQRYFGAEAALGKSIIVGNTGDQISYEITGVVKEMPENSHFDFDLLSSLSSNPNVKRRENTWIWTVFASYILLEENANIESLRKKIKSAESDYAREHIYPAFDMTNEIAQNSGRIWKLFLTPITDIHLNIADSGNRIGVVSDIFYVYVFSSIAFLIIVLASINFMNLSSARSVHRAKEVGIRKTLGSQKRNLIGQFLAESVLFSFIALVFALLIVTLSLNTFNQIASKHLDFTELFGSVNRLSMIGFTVLIGTLSGVYPAFYLSSFNPIEAFKGKISALSNNRLSFGGLRNLLVVVQFAISVILISSSIIIYQQLNFIQNKNLGFDKENVLIIENMERLNDQTETFKQLVEKEAGVLSVAESNAVPPQIWNEDFARVTNVSEPEIPLNSLAVDTDFIPTLNFKLIKGQNFEEGSGANHNYVILNETAVQQFTFQDGAEEVESFPLGESIVFGGSQPEYEIIGVIKDFNIASLHSDILPIGVFHNNAPIYKGSNRFLSVRLSPNTDISGLLATIETNWNQMTSGLPFDFSFLEEKVYAQYQSEQRIAEVVSIFTSLAIFIAILGLLGLISFSIEKRTKEIGVRKVMGASAGRIVFLLSKDMSKLIIISIIPAFPAAWWLMEKWLQNFAYRIDINFFVFVLSGVVAMVLSLAALSFQTIKAAIQNPVKSLRSE